MAVASRSSNSNAGTVAPTSPFNYPINQPAGLADGDVVLLTLVTNGSAGTVTYPSGFVETAKNTSQNPRVYECIKVITNAAGEPATWNFVGTAGVTFSTTSEAFTGVDLATPQDVPSTVTVNAAATSTQINGLTTVTDGAFIRTLLGINSSSAVITETSALVAQVVEVGGKVSEIDEGTQAQSGSTGPITFTISSSLASTGIITALRSAGASLMIREQQPRPLLIALLRWVGLGFGPFAGTQQPPLQAVQTDDRTVTTSITGGGVILPSASKTANGTPSVTGGGDILPSATKAASGVTSVTGGGVILPVDRKNGAGTAPVTGGGDIVIVGVSSSGTHNADAAFAITGGGDITIVATALQDAGGIGKRRQQFDDWTASMDDEFILELYLLGKTS